MSDGDDEDYERCNDSDFSEDATTKVSNFFWLTKCVDVELDKGSLRSYLQGLLDDSLNNSNDEFTSYSGYKVFDNKLFQNTFRIAYFPFYLLIKTNKT